MYIYIYNDFLTRNQLINKIGVKEKKNSESKHKT